MEKNLIVILTILLYMMPFYAKTEVLVSGDKCGDECYWEISDDGVLTVSGKGAIYDFNFENTGHILWEGGWSTWQTKAPWGEYSGQIKSIDIKEGITSIGDHAFYNLAAENVHIPSSVTSIVQQSFQYSKLKEIIIPDTVQYIGGAAFYMTRLSSVVIPENTQLASANNHYWIFTGQTKVYCAQNKLEECEDAVNSSVKIQTYQKDENGNFFFKNRWYKNPNDILTGKHIKKLRYTIEEAMKATAHGDKFHVYLTYK